MKITAVFVLSLVLSSACSSKSTTANLAAECSSGSQCAAGSFCISGRCLKPQCLDNGGCAAGNICRADFTCAPSAAAGPGEQATALTISNVAGDVQATRVRSGLVINGTGFDNATTAQILSTALNKTWDLVIGTANASTLSAALPSELATIVTSASGATALTLRVSSLTAGSATRDVSMLQGEPGAVGPTGAAGMNGAAGARGATGADFGPPSITLGVGEGPIALSVNHDDPAGTALSLSAPGGGTALKVENGSVDLSTAKVRLPIYVNEWAGGAETVVYAYCDEGDTLIGGGCQKNHAGAGTIAMSQMVLCDRPGTVDYAAHEIITTQLTCANIAPMGGGFASHTPLPSMTGALSGEAFWRCLGTGGGGIYAQATCLRGP